ncbi:MAG: acyltransferase family protein, partial [Phycisphaerales bacterium]|nr:acyltransferase family protein [Phycisphaerales bacterium]
MLLYHTATYVGTKLYGLPTGSHMPRELCDNAFFRFGSLGFFGVQLFFAISGFILAVPFARSALVTTDRRVSLRQYFLRRVTRLEPPYIFNLLVLAALLVAVKHEPVVQTLRHLLASIFYFHYYVYGEGSTINGVAWSLEIEVQFYILARVLWVVFYLRAMAVR